MAMSWLPLDVIVFIFFEKTRGTFDRNTTVLNTELKSSRPPTQCDGPCEELTLQLRQGLGRWNAWFLWHVTWQDQQTCSKHVRNHLFFNLKRDSCQNKRELMVATSMALWLTGKYLLSGSHADEADGVEEIAAAQELGQEVDVVFVLNKPWHLSLLIKSFHFSRENT